MADNKENEVPVVVQPGPSKLEQIMKTAKVVGIVIGAIISAVLGAAASGGLTLPPTVLAILNSILGLLAAEMLAITGRDPGELYHDLTRELGEPVYERLDAPATPEQKEVLQHLSPQQIQAAELAGEPILAMLTEAPGNGSASRVSNRELSQTTMRSMSLGELPCSE